MFYFFHFATGSSLLEYKRLKAVDYQLFSLVIYIYYYYYYKRKSLMKYKISNNSNLLTS